MPVEYISTVDRPLTDYLGEQLSVLSYGALGNGVADDAPAINAAIAALVSLKGRNLYFPGGRTYKVNSPIVIPSGVNGTKITLYGDGEATVIKRGANMPTGQGVFDIAAGAKYVSICDMMIDGNVTTATGLHYGSGVDFNYDPMHDLLTTNSSVWIHGNTQHIRFSGVTITHTGGYAILIDARADGDVDDVSIDSCLFTNNRPHLFGYTTGDLNYGSWTGGIHYQSDGTNFSVKNLSITNSTFRRITGNNLWGHLYALNKLHENIRIVGNHFEDTGLDAILMGGVSGGVVQNNTIRRVGYVATDDTSPATPKWLRAAGAGTIDRYSVGIDTAGLVKGVNYVGNAIISANGGFFDLDGYAQATVSGNTCIMPVSSDPEYAQDRIGLSGPLNNGENWSYGAQVSNSNNDATAGSGVNIADNTFINMGGGTIRLYATRGSSVTGNIIKHPLTPNFPPVAIGNVPSGGANQRSYDNVVADNTVFYTPPAAAPVVYEDAQYAAFTSTDKNWVANNRIVDNGGHAFEFQKDANSSSITAAVFSNASHNLYKSQATLQREGPAASAYTRMTINDAVTGDTVLWTLLDSGLYNVSKNGGAGTGALTTGGRTTLAWMDAVATGKLYGDAFLVLTDLTFSGTQANLLNDTYGLIRYNSTLKKFEQSTAVSGGARLWTDLIGSGSVVINGTANQVTVTGTGPYTIALPTNVIITGTAGAAGLALTNGYVQAADGFLTTSTAATAIQAPNGSVFGKYLIGAQAMFLLDATDASLSGSSQGKIRYTSGVLQASLNGGAWAEFFPHPTFITALITSTGAALTLNNGYVDSAGGFFTGSSATNAIQAPNGGVTASFLIGTKSLTMTGTSSGTAGVSGSGQGRIYFDSTDNRFKVSQNGGAFVDLLGASSGVTSVNSLSGALSLLGTASQVNVSSVGTTITLSLPQSIATTSSPTFDVPTATGSAIFSGGNLFLANNVGIAGTSTTGGVGQIFTLSTDNNLYLQNFVGSDVYIRPNSNRFVFIGAGTGSHEFLCPLGNLNTDLGSATFRWDQLYVRDIHFSGSGGYSGGAGISISGATITNTGVTSISGSNITVSGSGAVTISIPQSVATTASVAFNSLQLNQSSGFALNVPNTYIQSNGVNSLNTGYNGVQSAGGFSSGSGSQGGYYIGTSQMINPSGQFVGFGIVMPSYGISCAGINPFVSGVQYFGQNYDIVIPGGFTISGVGTFSTLRVKGGVIVGAA